MGEAILYFQPSMIAKIIFGYGTGAYLLIPSFGLLAPGNLEKVVSTHSWPGGIDAIKRRHAIIENILLIIFITVSILWSYLAYLVLHGKVN